MAMDKEIRFYKLRKTVSTVPSGLIVGRCVCVCRFSVLECGIAWRYIRNAGIGISDIAILVTASIFLKVIDAGFG